MRVGLLLVAAVAGHASTIEPGRKLEVPSWPPQATLHINEGERMTQFWNVVGWDSAPPTMLRPHLISQQLSDVRFEMLTWEGEFLLGWDLRLVAGTMTPGPLPIWSTLNAYQAMPDVVRPTPYGMIPRFRFDTIPLSAIDVYAGGVILSNGVRTGAPAVAPWYYPPAPPEPPPSPEMPLPEPGTLLTAFLALALLTSWVKR